MSSTHNSAADEPGWGLYYAWDAFSDGSMNPAYHVYGIEVANVIAAILDAIDSGAVDQELESQALTVLHDVAIIWNTKYWTEKSDRGEHFYWYSVSESDAIECINISAKMAGTFARLLTVENLFSTEERVFIGNRVDQTINRVYELAYMDEDVLVWNYLSVSGSRKNDVIHHAFILEGIFDYIAYRNVVPCGWSYEELKKYCENCVDSKAKRIYSYSDFSFRSAFDVGALPLIDDVPLRGKVLRNEFDDYMADQETDERQLAFLLDALGDYIVTLEGMQG